GGGYTLKPGQAFTNGKIINTNISQDIAWKNGFFNFDKIDLPAMLRQISRWYDIDIQYKGKIPQRQFGGRMRRDLNLSGVLIMLDNLGVKYELKNKTLLIN
ncbi:MAG: DUF4974 domain-containing protein, partial [Chitinophagaceae bacterium]|nr:DUF4974 domain-containing protein [Chitinophagaceae bacterium]